MTSRNILLKVHLYLGLSSAIFLVILTGSVMAFEGDIDHWLHPGLWHVTAGPKTLPEEELIHKVEQRFAPTRVAAVHISRQPNLSQLMQMTDRAAVLVNPYDGSILVDGDRHGLRLTALR